MRWAVKPPPAPGSIGERIILVALAPLWVPVAVIAVAVAAAGFGLLWCKRRLMGPTDVWRPWFAWFPITFDSWPAGSAPFKERVWLEWVERRAGHLLGDTVHRLKPASGIEARSAGTQGGPAECDAPPRDLGPGLTPEPQRRPETSASPSGSLHPTTRAQPQGGGGRS